LNRRTRPTDIILKTDDEIRHMRRAGSVVAAVLDRCADACRPGVTTGQLDELAYETFTKMGAEGLFKGHPHPTLLNHDYPGHTCISVNEQIVHGIPGDQVVQDGDIVSIDCGVRLDGWCADSAQTMMVGQVKPEAKCLVETTWRLLDTAIDMCRPGRWWSEIAGVMEETADRKGYGIIREYVGHGIGRTMHEPPKVPNFANHMKRQGADFRLEVGLVIAIEPMLTLGSGRTVLDDDGWTVLTADGQPATHQEHTVAILKDGIEVLTRS